jgi:hypothetical protein
VGEEPEDLKVAIISREDPYDLDAAGYINRAAFGLPGKWAKRI